MFGLAIFLYVQEEQEVVGSLRPVQPVSIPEICSMSPTILGAVCIPCLKVVGRRVLVEHKPGILTSTISAG